MISYVLSFLLGLLILLPCTIVLVKISKKLANKLRVSPLVTGITIVALGTSLPELAVSLTAAAGGDYGLALGNIVGSNITNVLLVLSVAILAGKLRIGTTKTQRNVTVLFIVSILYLIIHITNPNPLISGLILLLVGIFVTILEYIWGKKGGNIEDKIRVMVESKKVSEFRANDFFLLILSLLGIISGGLLIVNSTENISGIIRCSTSILGLSLTAIATSLPELLTTIFSQSKNDEKLTLGNIIGSSIYNLTFIGGITAFFRNELSIPSINWGWFILATIIIVSLIKIFKDEVVPKKVGFILIGVFFIYLYTLSFTI